MKNAHFRILIIFSSFTIALIIASQVYWYQSAKYQQSKVFSYNVQIALRNVVEAMCVQTGRDIPSENPIEQVSGNYFIVRTNDYIDLSSFDHLLSEEIKKRSVTDYFEYGVYDCESDEMVFAENVNFIDKSSQTTLPELQNQEYYFGVYFPERSRYFTGGFDFRNFTSLLTIVMVIFFGYTLYIILRQKRMSDLQRDFVNNVIHEIKTPLTTLSIASESLDNKNLEMYSGIIKREVSRLQTHVERILESSKMERSESAKSTLQLGRYLKGLIYELGKIHRETQFELEGKIDQQVEVQPEYLDMIIRNLIDNAIKNKAKTVKLKVEKNQKKLEISVIDDGSGIPKKYQKKVFEKFIRVPDMHNQHNVKGFGLGLYIVKTLTKKIGGKIHLQSEAGMGTTFKLSLNHV